MNKKHLTVADLERYFVNKVDEDIPHEKLFSEFALIIGARFVKFGNRNPDAYGVLTDECNMVHIYYDVDRDVYGFQVLSVDGTVQSVLPLKKSNCSIVDLFMRVAANIGKFSEQYSTKTTNKKTQYIDSDDDESDSSYISDSDSDDNVDSRGSDSDSSSEYED
jgi:hypothetical protein